jgi:hypothetical protein
MTGGWSLRNPLSVARRWSVTYKDERRTDGRNEREKAAGKGEGADLFITSNASALDANGNFH